MEDLKRTGSAFRHLLADLDPKWSGRSLEEQNGWVDWYNRTARAIARQYAKSFRDPSHDASDVLQDILLKLVTKFRAKNAPHRLLTERPCMRNLMEWKALDRVDWERASRRDARRRCTLPDGDFGLASHHDPSPDRCVELKDADDSFGSSLPDREEREAYRLFRDGRPSREVAKAIGRRVRETRALRDRLADGLRTVLVS